MLVSVRSGASGALCPSGRETVGAVRGVEPLAGQGFAALGSGFLTRWKSLVRIQCRPYTYGETGPESGPESETGSSSPSSFFVVVKERPPTVAAAGGRDAFRGASSLTGGLSMPRTAR